MGRTLSILLVPSNSGSNREKRRIESSLPAGLVAKLIGPGLCARIRRLQNTRVLEAPMMRRTLFAPSGNSCFPEIAKPAVKNRLGTLNLVVRSLVSNATLPPEHENQRDQAHEARPSGH
jgi:hypothetical protein